MIIHIIFNYLFLNHYTINVLALLLNNNLRIIKEINMKIAKLNNRILFLSPTVQAGW